MYSIGKYKKFAKDKITENSANIDKVVAECNAVIAVHDRLSAEKNELTLALQSGGSAVQVNPSYSLCIPYINMIF